MENTEPEEKMNPSLKYRHVITMIMGAENRLQLSELVFLTLDILVFLFTIYLINSMTINPGYLLTYFDIALIFVCITVGMSINAYWIAYAMRVQLRLKLRYFQARTLERKMSCSGICIFSDEDQFFDPDIRLLESFDDKEKLTYPTEGFTAMDGFVGSAKPRYFSWLIPSLFIAIYWSMFVLVLTKI